MEKVIFPLYLLPPTAYFKAMLSFDVVYLSLGEPFKKQTKRSRFEIMSPNKRHTLSVPLKKGKSNFSMKEVQISYEEDWQRKHWQALVTAYSASPFFEYFDYDLKPLFMSKAENLYEYNSSLLQWCFQKLKIQTQVHFTDELPNAFELIEGQKIQSYDQVFMEKHGYMSDLSILDWIFNVGV